MRSSRVWMRSSRVWMRSSREWMRSSRVWMRCSRVWMRSSRVWMRSSRVLMRSSRVWMRSSRMWMRSSRAWMRFGREWMRMRCSRMWMRSSRVVRASDSQCRSRNCLGFDPSILRHSGIWGAANEAVLNIVNKKIPKNPNFYITICSSWGLLCTDNLKVRSAKGTVFVKLGSNLYCRLLSRDQPTPQLSYYPTSSSWEGQSHKISFRHRPKFLVGVNDTNKRNGQSRSGGLQYSDFFY
jgi:hypothetical protein